MFMDRFLIQNPIQPRRLSEMCSHTCQVSAQPRFASLEVQVSLLSGGSTCCSSRCFFVGALHFNPHDPRFEEASIIFILNPPFHPAGSWFVKPSPCTGLKQAVRGCTGPALGNLLARACRCRPFWAKKPATENSNCSSQS